MNVEDHNKRDLPAESLIFQAGITSDATSLSTFLIGDYPIGSFFFFHEATLIDEIIVHLHPSVKENDQALSSVLAVCGSLPSLVTSVQSTPFLPLSLYLISSSPDSLHGSVLTHIM